MGTEYVARYTLRRIEEILSPNLEWTLKSPSKVHIEHIVPQHLSEPWREALRAVELGTALEGADRLGNLTLLAELNKEARDCLLRSQEEDLLGLKGSRSG